MVYGLSLRVSWICLLFFSSGSCFPTAKQDYKYPYTASLGSSGVSVPRSFPSQDSRAPLVNLQYGPSANYQPGVAPQQEPSDSTGKPSPSSVGAHSVVVGVSPSYEPNRFLVSSGSSSNKPFSAPEVSSQGAGYISPPRPASTGGFSVQSQPAGTSGHSSGGSGGPVYSPSRYMAPTLDFGDGPVPYIGDPAFFNYGSGLLPNANTAPHYPADTGRPASHYSIPETNYGYDAAPEASSGAGFGSSPGLPWVVEPVEASFSDPNEWMPRGEFPDFSVWQSSGSSSKMSKNEGETSPVPSSTYIIQSRNGYVRAQELQSHTNYAPEEAEPLLFVAEPVRVPTKTRPAAPKGGKKF